MVEAPPGTQAIGRALAVLRHLSDANGERTAVALASDLGLSSGTTHRILRALEVDGLVTQNPRTDAWLLGSGAILLGQAAQRVLGLERALPVLEQVNAETDESVNLTVREGGESVVMLRVQSTHPLRFEQQSGARFPLYTTASGKAILAFSGDRAQYLASLPKDLHPLTPHTLRSPDALAVQLDEVRERGWSIDEQENVEGVRCVGAPVLDPAGAAQAALVIQAPLTRMPDERRVHLAELAIDGAREVSRLLHVDRRLSR